MPELEKDFMDDLHKDGFELEGDPTVPPRPPQDPPAPSKEPEKKPDDKKEDVPPEKPGEEGGKPPVEPKKPEVKPNQPRGSRETRSWELGAMRRELTKEFTDAIAALKTEITSAISSIKPGDAGKPAEAKPTAPQIAELRKSLVEKLGLEEKEADEMLSKMEQAFIPPELKQSLERLKTLEDKQKDFEGKERAQAEEDNFVKEFSESINPIIEEEFPGISQEKLAAIKNKLHELAYDPRYAGKQLADGTVVPPVPLDVIYRGESVFRGLGSEGKSTAERGGGAGRGKNRMVDYENLSEEEFGALPPDKQFEATEYLATRERKS